MINDNYIKTINEISDLINKEDIEIKKLRDHIKNIYVEINNIKQIYGRGKGFFKKALTNNNINVGKENLGRLMGSIYIIEEKDIKNILYYIDNIIEKAKIIDFPSKKQFLDFQKNLRKVILNINKEFNNAKKVYGKNGNIRVLDFIGIISKVEKFEKILEGDQILLEKSLEKLEKNKYINKNNIEVSSYNNAFFHLNSQLLNEINNQINHIRNLINKIVAIRNDIYYNQINIAYLNKLSRDLDELIKYINSLLNFENEIEKDIVDIFKLSKNAGDANFYWKLLRENNNRRLKLNHVLIEINNIRAFSNNILSKKIQMDPRNYKYNIISSLDAIINDLNQLLQEDIKEQKLYKNQTSGFFNRIKRFFKK